ncbi:MAG: zinc ribbon domain-containing protein [Phycisphaerae bacterium]|nr:zinc ribbon domain-containing protein [Phycisphaerae bacterium]
MPTYEYECGACGHSFEKFQSITARPLRKCPECGKSKLQRLIGSGAGIIFRGSGFYETDYRSAEYKKAAKAEKESSSGTDSKKSEGGKSEKKTETKKQASKDDKAVA